MLISCCFDRLLTPNIVSLSYEKDDLIERDVLSVGVIDINDSTPQLPKIIVYETSQKWVKVHVETYEEGVIKALNGPCEGGCKIHTEGVGNGGGTLGMIRQCGDGQVYLYSCAHVLTEHNERNIQKNVYVEGDTDPVAVVEDHVHVEVYNRVDAGNRERYSHDLAWAKINPGTSWTLRVKEIGAVKGVRPPVENEMVKFYGAASLDVQGGIKIKSTNATTVVKVEEVGYKDVIKLDTSNPTYFEEGDSGSAMVAESDTKVVGLLMSGGRFGYACKLVFSD